MLLSCTALLGEHVKLHDISAGKARNGVDGESDDSSSAHTDPSLAEETDTGYQDVSRDVEFQGCGVPSAFADPGAYETGNADQAADEDRLTDLPKLPLQMRSSGLRVRSLPAHLMSSKISYNSPLTPMVQTLYCLTAYMRLRGPLKSSVDAAFVPWRNRHVAHRLCSAWPTAMAPTCSYHELHAL